MFYGLQLPLVAKRKGKENAMLNFGECLTLFHDRLGRDVLAGLVFKIRRGSRDVVPWLRRMWHTMGVRRSMWHLASCVIQNYT